MTTDQLHPAEAAYRAALTRVETVERRARDQAIRDALAAGQSQREVARMFDLSPGRIAQIAHGTR